MKPSRLRKVFIAFGLLLAIGTPVRAQLEEHPGYFPSERFGLLSSESLSLEINLSGALLGLVAAALDDEDPEFSELVRGLEGIRVRVAEADDLDLEALRSGFSRATSWLQANGWDTLLRVREDDEEFYVYTRLDEGEMVGMALLALEPGDEVVMVNVIGRLDLALMAALADSLDIPQLGVVGRDSQDDDSDSEEND